MGGRTFRSGQPLDAGASQGAEPPPSSRTPSPVSGHLLREVASSPRKRQLEATSADEPLPTKRARLARTETHAEPLVRSARLRARQHLEDSGDLFRIAPSTSRELQIQAGAGTFATERSRLQGGNTQSVVEDEQTAVADEQPQPSKREDTSPTEPNPGEQEKVFPATRLQKRQIGGDSDGDGDGSEHQLKRVRLTRKNLTLFNNMARKKGTNMVLASASAESTTESSTAKTTSTTTSGFALQADKNGILDPLSSKPPRNLEDIRTRHGRSRATASPPESVHEDYLDTVGSAVNESTVVCDMLPLLKTYPKEGYKKAFNQAFTGFPKAVGFNNGLSAPQPDFIEGLRRREFRPFPVDEHVSGAVLYKDNPHSLTLPHLAGEWKGRGKDMEEARLQSAYDGAGLVYARNQALASIGKSDLPGHAEVTTFTTDGTNLNFFAHYATLSEDGTLEYHQYPYASTNLTKFHEFKDGRRGLRNEQDHARNQSYALRDQLKEHWTQRRDTLQPTTDCAPLLAPATELPGPTNAHEDEDEDDSGAGHAMVKQPCEPTPPASSKPERLPKHDKTPRPDCSSSQSLPPVSGAQKRKASLAEGEEGLSHSASRPRGNGKD